MRELVEFIAKKLVTHPEDVQIRVIEGDEGVNLELRVNPDDMGTIIGKDGRTVKALRSVLSAAAGKADARVSLNIVE